MAPGARRRRLHDQYRAVLRQEGSRTRIELDGDLRRAMRRETEMVFAHIAHEDRSVLELIDSDYTFVNAQAGAALRDQGRDRQRDAQGHSAQGQPPRRRARRTPRS